MQQFVSWRSARANTARLQARLGVLMLALLVLVTALPAQSTRRYGLSDLVEKSEQIFIGQCVEKKTELREGMIVSRYTLRASDVLKSKAPLPQDIIVEEYGGELPEAVVPIGQYVTGMADLQKGEEVLLFTAPRKADPKVAAARTAREQALQAKGVQPKKILDPSAQRILGMNQGHFTLLTDPGSGKRFVTSGANTREALARRFARDEATSGPLRVSSRSIKSNPLPDAATAKALAERAAATDQILPMEPLDQVKQRITQLVQKSK